MSKYYIVTDGRTKETFVELNEALECYMDWCNATEFVEITTNHGEIIEQSW